MFTGANVANITKVKQSDIFKNVIQTVVGTVAVPVLAEGEALKMGTLLSSSDGGVSWSSRTTEDYDATNAPFALDVEVYFEGHIFKSTAAANETVPGAGDWEDLGAWDANGILYNDITENKKTTVVVTGDVISKQLTGLDEHLKITLFKNKLIVK